MSNTNFDLPRPQDPVPSSRSAVINDDAKVLDYLINSTGVVITRTGKTLLTWQEITERSGFSNGGEFGQGGIINSNSELVFNPADGWFYQHTGSTPASIPSAPDANWKKFNANNHAFLTGRNPGDGSSHNASDIGRGSSTVDSDLTTLEEDVGSLKTSVIELKNQTVKRCHEWGESMLAGVNPVINCYGDSTMWGATVGNLPVQDPQNAPASLSQVINLLFGTTITPANYAISGSTLRGMISGTDGSGSTFESKISAGGVSESANIIYCNHGINDSQLNLSIDQYRQDLYEFVLLCRKYNKTPVLVTPNPNPPIGLIDTEKTKRLRNFVETMRDVASQVNCDIVDQFYYFEQTFKLVPSDVIVADGAHLISRGYQQAGYNLAIPLISVSELTNPGDIAGLTNVTFFDNLQIDRRFEVGRGNDFGPILIADTDGVTIRGLSYPFILNTPQMEIDIGCMNWSDGTSLLATINSSMNTFSQVNLSKKYGNTSVIDWNAVYQARISGSNPIWAGLNVLGLIADNSFPSKGFAFSGVGIPSKKQWSSVVRRDSQIKQAGINTLQSFLSSSVLFTNSGDGLTFNDKSGAKVLDVVKDSGQCKIRTFKDGVVVESADFGPSTIADGNYPVLISISYNSVTVALSNIGITMPIANQLPEIYAATAWVGYTVETFM